MISKSAEWNNSQRSQSLIFERMKVVQTFFFPMCINVSAMAILSAKSPMTWTCSLSEKSPSSSRSWITCWCCSRVGRPLVMKVFDISRIALATSSIESAPWAWQRPLHECLADVEAPGDGDNEWSRACLVVGRGAWVFGTSWLSPWRL